MRTVSGTYIKNGEAVPFEFKVAACWDELTPRQAGFMLQVLTFRNLDKFMRAVSLLALLVDDHFNTLANLNDEMLWELIPLTNFIIDSQPPPKNLFPLLNPTSDIRPPKSLLAPADDLSNIGFGEWCFAYQAYSIYGKTNDEAWLNKLIAILYRPADPGQRPGSANFRGDRRERFNENLITYREAILAGISPDIKQAVLAWFAAALLQLMAARPNVFPFKKDDQDAEPDPMGEHRTWFTVFREIIGPKWGTTDELKHTNAFFVLDALEEQEIALNALRTNS